MNYFLLKFFIKDIKFLNKFTLKGILIKFINYKFKVIT